METATPKGTRRRWGSCGGAGSPIPPARDLGERCKLPQWSPGVSPGRSRFRYVFNPVCEPSLDSSFCQKKNDSSERLVMLVKFLPEIPRCSLQTPKTVTALNSTEPNWTGSDRSSEHVHSWLNSVHFCRGDVNGPQRTSVVVLLISFSG